MKNRVPTIKEILNLEKISHYPIRVQLDIHGELFDYCRNELENCGAVLSKWNELLIESERTLKNSSFAYVYYYYYAHYWSIKGSLTPSNPDDWYNYFQERSIYCLRKSVASFDQMMPEDTYDEMIDQILTNLGAEMADMGRNVEALRYFQRVLNVNTHFNVAIGNIGICQLELAQSTEIIEEKCHLLRKAKETLQKVQDDHIVSNENIFNFQEALRITEIQLKSISKGNNISFKEPKDFPKEMEQSEKDYRDWALQKKLFLNILCEADLKDEAASDTLTLYKGKHKNDVDFEKYNGYFNHIIEHFTISRWFFYEGTHPELNGPHFSEKRISYSHMSDDSIISIGKQKLFASFMLCYSILDKLALFINDYFELKIGIRTDLNLRNLWYQDFPHNKNLRKSVRRYMDNPHLKALYWLSKDVYYREQHEEIIEPSARDWRKIRNHLAHEFIRVTEHELNESSRTCDPNSYCISYMELQKRCLSMLQLIRDSIVYLTLAVTHEELKEGPQIDNSYAFFDSQYSEEPVTFTKK